ncbi:MAG: NAD(P)/FAD-dependent oxidoreductase, partial [Candidatus Aerophobetes bacterium]
RRRVKCAVNPAAGEERRFEMRKSLSPKKVAVVGAGPAGMEAALVASQRGHNVILFEEKDSIGGKMVFASVPQFKPEIGKLLEYYERSLKRSPVEVRLGQRISALDDFSRESHEVVIVAVGADPLVPEIPGIEKEKVLTVLQLFEDKTLKIGKEVVVVGAGLIGSETSWYLASQNKSVTVVDTLARESILEDEHPTNRSMLIRSMEKEGVKILEKREIVRIEEEGAVVKRENGTEELLRADNVVFATGFEPKGDLRGALSKVSFDAEVYFIGDCVEPRKLCEAIHEGYHAAWKI